MSYTVVPERPPGGGRWDKSWGGGVPGITAALSALAVHPALAWWPHMPAPCTWTAGVERKEGRGSVYRVPREGDSSKTVRE